MFTFDRPRRLALLSRSQRIADCPHRRPNNDQHGPSCDEIDLTGLDSLAPDFQSPAVAVSPPRRSNESLDDTGTKEFLPRRSTDV